MPTFKPCLFAQTASSEVTSDLPTPPLPLVTAIIFLITVLSFGLIVKSLSLHEESEQDEQL
jgi:hypothetical protein